MLLSSQPPQFTVDLTVTISVILGIAAIISPVLVAIVNGFFQCKMRKIELREAVYKRTILKKQYALEKFIKALSSCAANQNEQSLKELGEYYPLAYMYSPDDVRKTMTEVYFHAVKQNWDEVRKYIDLLSTDTHKTITELQQPKKPKLRKLCK